MKNCTNCQNPHCIRNGCGLEVTKVIHPKDFALDYTDTFPASERDRDEETHSKLVAMQQQRASNAGRKGNPLLPAVFSWRRFDSEKPADKTYILVCVASFPTWGTWEAGEFAPNNNYQARYVPDGPESWCYTQEFTPHIKHLFPQSK